MLKYLTLKGVLSGIGAMMLTCSICWVLVFIAGVRPLNWLAGTALDANQSYMALIVTVGLLGTTLLTFAQSLFKKR